MLVPELILLPGQTLQFVFPRSDGALDIVEFGQKLLSFGYLILPAGIVIYRLGFVFVSLGLQTIELDLEFIDSTRDVFEFCFGSPDLILFLLQLSNELSIVILGLKQCLVQSGVVRLTVPGCSL